MSTPLPGGTKTRAGQMVGRATEQPQTVLTRTLFRGRTGPGLVGSRGGLRPPVNGARRARTAIAGRLVPVLGISNRENFVGHLGRVWRTPTGRRLFVFLFVAIWVRRGLAGGGGPCGVLVGRTHDAERVCLIDPYLPSFCGRPGTPSPERSGDKPRANTGIGELP